MKFLPHGAITALAIAFFTASVLSWNDANSQTKPETSAEVPSETTISDGLNKPRRHFRVDRAAALDDDAARDIYNRLQGGMAKGYALSETPAAKNYQSWKRYNSAPYGSSTHGNRFVNNYANAKAAAYGKYEAAGKLPPGAVIAKDSFMVADDGAAAPGPLFIMEKMPEGFSYVSGDWRYTMIMPDGSVFGATRGANTNRVEFCIGCHLAQEKVDHLYFLPEKWRVR
ncbi:MAG: hypothetical protein HOM25_06150 [Rhodospirillaceae bacterium]|jgi:hypothetical protein|nr:hypothetical protein [Rhodospirillaceae bacterium]MBT5667100.1 hypothetical protein [Rhodospirillaceae bacterium]MBT5809071.1 hypothetical protein [Rhodospirillaceae bacterium]